MEINVQTLLPATLTSHDDENEHTECQLSSVHTELFSVTSTKRLRLAMLGYLMYIHNAVNYRKYSARRGFAAGTCRSLSDTAEKMVNLGSKSSPRFMIEATFPQR